MRGRDAEIDALSAALREAQEGRGGSVVLVEGPRGSGKSRLLREAGARAVASGFRVAHGTAVSDDADVSMSSLLSALLDGPEPVLDRATLTEVLASDDHARRIHAFETALHEVARNTPVLVCVDDLQWADRATTAALRVLCQRLASAPIVWTISHRSRAIAPHVMEVVTNLQNRGCRGLVLQPLAGRDVMQLVAGVAGAEPTSEVLELAARANGNPALLIELVGGLLDEDAIRVEQGRAQLLEARVPRHLCELVRADLARVSPEARHAATVTAILGRKASFGLLAAMLEVPPAALLAPVDDLVRAELLVDTRDRLRFVSDLVRDAVLGSVQPTVRHALQRHAIAVLLQAGESPLEPAAMLASGAEPGDRDTVAIVADAARGLASCDAEAAAELCGRALDLCLPGDEMRPGLVAELALLLHAVGRAEEGKQVADDARSDRLEPEGEAAILLSIARMPDLAPAVRTEAGRDALTLPGLPRPQRARHLSEWIGNLVSEGRLAAAREALLSVEPTISAGEDDTRLDALGAARAQLGYVDGSYRDALRQLEEIGTTTRDADEHARLAGLLRGESLVALDEFDAAHRLASDGIAGAGRDHRWSTARAWRRLRGRAMLQEGRIRAAGATLDGVFTGETGAVRTTGDAAALAALGRVAIHTGDARRLRILTKIAEGVLVDGAPEMRRHAAWLLALGAAAGGDPAEAREWIAAIDPDADASVLPRLMVDTTDFPRLVRIARDVGDDALARATVAAADQARLTNPDVASIVAAAAHARGLYVGDVQQLAEAVDVFSRGSRRLAHASALEDYAIGVVAQGDRANAVDALTRALKLYSGCGATWDASRVRRRLRDLGVRRRIVKAARPASGWGGLTDGELAVVRLVAEGLTNRVVAERLYVSPHTVSMHLRHVFTKLGITSRVELTRLVYQHDKAA
jgi:DNA-binding NarL/FixJ family response regulator